MRIETTKKLALGFVLLLITHCGVSIAAGRDNLVAAQSAFQYGRADDALRLLDGALGTNPEDAAAWNLQCRVYLAQARWNDAVDSCKRAVDLVRDSSNYHLWLGRAYGEKASHSKLVSAYKLAKQTHAEFETAVALDGNNRDALSDIGQYYVRAPSMLGGGYPKAEAIVDRLNAIDPAEADELEAMIAESKKDYPSSEQKLRARISASQSSEATAQAWMDLGSFYRRRGRLDEMMTALESGAAADKNHGPALVDGASTLIAARREPELAEKWLRLYLSGNGLSESAPAFAVHAELGELLKKQGDAQEAEREFAAARALSANYGKAAAPNTGE